MTATAAASGGAVRNLTRGQWRLLLGGTALGLLGVVCTLAQPVLLADLIRSAGDHRPVVGVVVALVVLFLLDAVLSAAQGCLIGRAGENIVRDARVLLSGKVLRADRAHLDTQRQETCTPGWSPTPP